MVINWMDLLYKSDFKFKHLENIIGLVKMFSNYIKRRLFTFYRSDVFVYYALLFYYYYYNNNNIVYFVHNSTTTRCGV